jgi:hypothetical protein
VSRGGGAHRASSARPPLTSQRLKEDEDRPKYNSNAADYSTDGVCGSHRLRNQIEQKKAHHQEDDEPLDPSHVILLIFRSSPQTIRTPCRVYRRKPRSFPPLACVRWRRKAITSRRADLVTAWPGPHVPAWMSIAGGISRICGRERLGPPYVLPHLREVAERLDAMTLVRS